MSQQSNPATLREAAKLLAMHLKHAESDSELEEDLIFATLEKVAALAASGTEAAPPVRSASSKTTENGLRDVGTVTRAQVSSAEGSVATSTPKRGPRTANHLEHVQRFLTEMYQVMVDPVEEFNGDIEQLCALLIARAKQERETIHGRGQGERHLTESQKAVEEAAGMNLDWNMAAGYDAGQLSAQAAASPGGEGREAAKPPVTADDARYWQLRAAHLELELAALRQSAAPSGGTLRETLEAVQMEIDCPARGTRLGYRHGMYVMISSELRQKVKDALAQESQTGAVTPIANQICRCGHGIGQHEWEDRTTSMCLFQPCSCTGFAPETGAVTETK